MRGAWLVAVFVGLGVACSDGGGGGSGLPTTTAGGSTTTAPAPPPTVAAGADYCGLARRYFKAFERFGQPGTPLELRSYYRDASAAMDQARQVAPAEIGSDLDVVADTLRVLTAGLEGIGYDFSRVASLPPELVARLRSQQFIDSSTRVAAYSRDRCGIS